MKWALAFFERIKRKMEMGNENEKVNLFVQVFIGFTHHKYITNNSWNDYAVFFAIYYHALDLSSAKSILEHTCKVDDFFLSVARSMQTYIEHYIIKQINNKRKTVWKQNNGRKEKESTEENIRRIKNALRLVNITHFHIFSSLASSSSFSSFYY